MNVDVTQGLSEIFIGIVTPILLSITATIVRVIRYGWRGFGHFLVSVSTSVFVGVVVSWALTYFSLQSTVDAAIISIAAYMSGTLLDSIVFRTKRIIQEGAVILPGKKNGTTK